MSIALNAICPYFTMFPLEFPFSILKRYGSAGESVFDPFAGRGTTLYAARLLGLNAIGIDSNPVAVAISEGKLANTTRGHIVASARRILKDAAEPKYVPDGVFWELAFHRDVLRSLCQLREALMYNCESDSRKALRAVILGALHGPLTKTEPSYFSNQCPRTYSPKPRYATKFWYAHGLTAPRVNVFHVVERRAARYFGEERTTASGRVIAGDSQNLAYFSGLPKSSWIVTSPPYYGMRTYIPDQWLRLWFLGGKPDVDYSNTDQLSHCGREVFRQGLEKVWTNCATVVKLGARLVIRFGAINDRRIDPIILIKDSLRDTP